jgi:adenylate kinase family enzyme
MAQGDLLPDTLMASLVQTHLASHFSPHDHWLLDGFPRTLDQALLLDELLSKDVTQQPLNMVINLDVPHHTILQRIQGKPP